MNPTETLHIPLADDTIAIVTITVRQDGHGHIDPPIHRRPNLTDLQDVILALRDRNYHLAPQTPLPPLPQSSHPTRIIHPLLPRTIYLTRTS